MVGLQRPPLRAVRRRGAQRGSFSAGSGAPRAVHPVLGWLRGRGRHTPGALPAEKCCTPTHLAVVITPAHFAFSTHGKPEFALI